MSPPGNTVIIRTGLLLLLIGFGGFLYWSLTMPLAKGVVATGSIIVDGKRKTIQHLEGGIIAAIYVKDGDRVERGQLLLELDSTHARAQRDLLEVRLQHTQALTERLHAERSAQVEIRFSQNNSASELQRSLFQARMAQKQGQVSLLLQRMEQLKRKVSGLEAQSFSLLKQQSLVIKELERSEGLFQKQLLDLPQMLRLQKEESQINGEYGHIQSEIAATEVAIGEAELEILQLEHVRQQEVAEQLLQSEERLLELNEQLATAEDVLERIKIYAPQNGVVLDLSAHTIGGVIAPGSAILELVPESDRLVLEARVQPADIDHVVVGMTARIRLSALKQRSTPMLKGQVEFVSADALMDEGTRQSYYLAQIVIAEDERSRLGVQQVIPGMPVEVLVDAGKRTAMEYLLDPLEDVVVRGMREE